ncbi:MAG TPA: RNA polymerase sigma factor [Planctomycetota bacterium]|nr:RNA polymerase sigma factor [Planctomycetota bacterium]
MSIPTEDLIRAARAGDRLAAEELARSSYSVILAIARRRTRSAHDAEDAAQNVMLEMFLHLEHLQDSRKYFGWLKTLTVRACVNLHRGEARRRRTAASVQTPEHACTFADEENASRIRAAAARLRPMLRESLELHYWCGHSVNTISAMLSIPPGTVKRRLHDAREQLRNELGENSEKRANLRHAPGDLFDEEGWKQNKSVMETGTVTSAEPPVPGWPALGSASSRCDAQHFAGPSLEIENRGAGTKPRV